jgi:hypothetical protein
MWECSLKASRRATSIILSVRTLRILALFILPLCASAQSLTITHATVVDTVSGKLTPDSTVVIQGNRIASVSSAKTRTPKTDKIIDAHGQYLIPGLWDMHTHVFFGGTSKDGTDIILPLFLANGITGIRDMGSDLDLVLKAREDVAAHRLLGPRMVVSGPMLDGPKSHYHEMISVPTPEAARIAVDMLKARGVDFIKVQSNVPREAYFAVVDQAAKDHIEFEGHVPDAIRASEAVTSNQRTFEHLIGIFEASSPDEDKYVAGAKKTPGVFLDTYDPAREAAIIQLLAKNHVWQCPTLFWERGQWLVDVIDFKADPDIAFAPASWVAKKWPGSQRGIAKSMDTDPVPIRENFVAHELDIVRKLHGAGVPFLAGTDTPAGVDLIPGISLHLELQRFVAAGFTPLEALQTATLNPAKFFGKLNDYGTVQQGRVADLLLLDANPLEDISNTRKIAAIVTDGRYLSSEDLTQLRTKLKTLAAQR